MFLPIRAQCTVLLLLAASLTGCGSRAMMGRYTYRVSLSETLRDANTGIMPSIEVDFVGLNEVETYRWRSLNIDKYFTPGNLRRKNADRHTMPFTNERSTPQTLTAGDRHWNSWQRSGAKNMIILASIPLSSIRFADDPRRLILPLDRVRWARGQKIDIVVTPKGVVVATPMRPFKP